MFIRGTIKKVTENLKGLNLFSASGLPGEDFVDRDISQQRGFYSIPEEGDFAFILKFGNFVVCLGTDTKNKPSLEAPESAQYLDKDTHIICKKDGSIEITSKKKEIILNGDLKVTGEVTAMYKTALVNLSSHVHPTSTGATSPPTIGT